MIITYDSADTAMIALAMLSRSNYVTKSPVITGMKGWSYARRCRSFFTSQGSRRRCRSTAPNARRCPARRWVTKCEAGKAFPICPRCGEPWWVEECELPKGMFKGESGYLNDSHDANIAMIDLQEVAYRVQLDNRWQARAVLLYVVDDRSYEVAVHEMRQQYRRQFTLKQMRGLVARGRSRVEVELVDRNMLVRD